jgi:hypothetical protein
MKIRILHYVEYVECGKGSGEGLCSSFAKGKLYQADYRPTATEVEGQGHCTVS